MKTKLIGDTSTLPVETYKYIYDNTGIDIDGRLEFIKQVVPGMENSIKRFINFAKGLPGFRDLPMDDQIILIKGFYLSVVATSIVCSISLY